MEEACKVRIMAQEGGRCRTKSTISILKALDASSHLPKCQGNAPPHVPHACLAYLVQPNLNPKSRLSLRTLHPPHSLGEFADHPFSTSALGELGSV